MKLSNNKNFNVTHKKNGCTIVRLIKKNKFEQIKESLEACDFNVSIDYGNTCVNVTKKHGGFLFEFSIHYSKQIKNLISSDYLNPEEANIIATITDIEEFIVYDSKSNIIELEDKEQEILSDIVYMKLVGTQITS